MEYLSVEAIKLLLSIPNMKCKDGRRDLALLAVLYDSGARVQELADLVVGSIRERKPATVKLTGKGNKTRIIPIMPQTLEIVRQLKMSAPESFLKIGIQLIRNRIW